VARATNNLCDPYKVGENRIDAPVGGVPPVAELAHGYDRSALQAETAHGVDDAQTAFHQTLTHLQLSLSSDLPILFVWLSPVHNVVRPSLGRIEC